MYNKISVVKPTGIASGAAAAKDPNVVIFDFDDVAVFPPRDSKGVRHVGDIVWKPNKLPITIYMTKSKISAPYESDGDEDSISIKQSFEGQHPGNKLEIREFIQNWLGRNVGIMHRSCAESEWEIVGTPCAPLQLKPSKQDNNDGRFHMLKFEAFAKSSFLPGLYTGAVTFAAPVVVEDATDVTINNLEGYVYQMPSSAAGNDIKLVWGSMPNDATFTLLGGGGTDPDTLATGAGGAGFMNIILKDGVAWVGLAGSFLTLQAISSAPNYFLEVNRG